MKKCHSSLLRCKICCSQRGEIQLCTHIEIYLTTKSYGQRPSSARILRNIMTLPSASMETWARGRASDRASERIVWPFLLPRERESEIQLGVLTPDSQSEVSSLPSERQWNRNGGWTLTTDSWIKARPDLCQFQQNPLNSEFCMHLFHAIFLASGFNFVSISKPQRQMTNNKGRRRWREKRVKVKNSAN